MKRITASLEDVRIWNRALKSYNGAFGTGGLDDRPERDGRLWGCIPLAGPALKLIWGVLGISTEHPESGWHKIDQFDEYLVALDALKYSRWLASKFWMCPVSFYFQHAAFPGRDMLEVKGVGWFYGESIPGLFISADALLLRFEPLPPMTAFAQSLFRSGWHTPTPRNVKIE